MVDTICQRTADFSAVPEGEAAGLKDMITDATARIMRTAALSRAAAMAKYAEEDLTEAAAALYADVVATRGAELKRALIVQASSISYAHLDEFDWSLRVAMSSSSLSSMRKPILLLKLSLKRPGGEVESHVVELPKDALDGLIASMEGANKVIKYMCGARVCGDFVFMRICSVGRACTGFIRGCVCACRMCECTLASLCTRIELCGIHLTRRLDSLWHVCVHVVRDIQ